MDKETVAELVKTDIQQKIVQAFKDTPEMIDTLIRSVFEKEVDEHGQKPDYHTKTKMPWLEWCIGHTIQDIARKAIKEHIGSMADQIEDKVRKALTDEVIVKSFADNVGATMKKDWSIWVQFKETE